MCAQLCTRSKVKTTWDTHTCCSLALELPYVACKLKHVARCELLLHLFIVCCCRGYDLRFFPAYRWPLGLGPLPFVLTPPRIDESWIRNPSCPLSTVAAAGRNYATCRNFTQTEEEEEQIKPTSRRRSSSAFFPIQAEDSVSSIWYSDY